MRRGLFAFLFILAGLVPAFAGDMVQSTLYFGLSRPDGGQVEEAQWQDFLTRDVTPKFPDGFTVLDGRGQWRDANAVIISERTKVLVIVHPITDENTRAIAGIKAAYVKRFHQESVFQTDQDVRVVE
ncbi:MAG: DUF3574 domain-containing protein [Parvibaculum sp.]|nr:DUF3574 domain-containing protein [Parvibaculum sp.]